MDTTKQDCCKRGIIITPCDPGYQQARQVWNRAIQKYPLGIAYCAGNEDVSEAVCWAKKHHKGIRMRSGGHNYEGYSVGNDGLVIDVSRMNCIDVCEERNTVRLQGGVNNRILYDAVASKGYPFPGGACPTVGIPAYTLGGGWGYSCRHFGLGCDSLLEAEMIDSQGCLIKASEHCNPDLFWACRGGGGGNFGVVTSMTFKLPPKVDKVTLVEIYYPHVTAGVQVQFLDTWQYWVQQLDRRMTMRAGMYVSSTEGRAIFCRSLFYGTPAELKCMLQPLLAIGTPEIYEEYTCFYKIMQSIENSYPCSEMFKSTGRFQNHCLNIHTIESIVELLNCPPKGSVFTEIAMFALGGKVSDVCPRETAFFYRDAAYILGIQSVWENPCFAQDNIRWVDCAFNRIEPITQGSYVNFPYSGLKDYEKAYYGGNVCDLRLVKRRVDPCDVFWFPQGIR